MNTILIYLHLAVIFSVGAFFISLDRTWSKAFGALNATFALAYAYFYAIYHLWAVMTK